MPEMVQPANKTPGDEEGVGAAPPAQDEEIHCSYCNYNLSGNLSGRCPECGSLFHRESLIAAQDANRVTLIPWDDPEEKPLGHRLKETLRISLFNTERFALAFGVQPQRSRAASFLVLIMLAVLVSLAAIAYGWFGVFGDAISPTQVTTEELIASLITFVVTIIGSIATTTLLAAAVLWLLCPHYDGRLHFRPWLSMSAYGSAHYLLVAAGLPVLLAALYPMVLDAPAAFMGALLASWTGCGLLNFCTLTAVVRRRCQAAGGQRLAVVALAAIVILAPPVVAVFSALGIGLIMFLFL